MVRLITSIFVLLTCCQFGWAQYGYYPPYHQQVIVKEVIKEVAAPIAVPVLVPATVFQYLPALQPAAVPAIPAKPVAPTAPSPQQPTQADIDAMIRARVDAMLRARLGQGDSGPPALVLPNEQAQPAQPAPANLDQQLASALASASCVRCHTAGTGKPVKGNVTLFVKKGEDLFFQPSVSKQQILKAVTPDASGAVAMPPSGERLPDATFALLKQWAAKQ